jgi:hypothetical protein
VTHAADATGENHEERKHATMGKIGEFLNNKPWHPSSRQNQTLLFEAEERQREEQQRLEERQEELKQERAREELDALLPNRGGAKPAGIDFMYKAPTGTNTSGAAPRAGAADEAALAFEARRLAAARRKRGEPEPVPEPVVPEPVIPEPEPERPPPSSKTFDAHAEARRVDPAERQRNLTSAAIAQTALDARNRLVLKAAATAAVASDGVVRAHGSANEGYALLDDDEEEEDADAALLASLSSREKRALLKRLAGDDDARPAKKRKKKHKKKSKKKKKKRSSSSSSSSS